MATQTKLVKKITVNGLCGTPKANPKEAYVTARVYGIANEGRGKQNDKGEYVEFLGAFEGMNISTGEVINSPKVILPEVAQNMVFAALQNSSAVQFGFEFGIAPKEGTIRGYEITCIPMIKTVEGDPLADMRQKMLALESGAGDEKDTGKDAGKK